MSSMRSKVRIKIGDQRIIRVQDMSTAYLADYGGGPPGHPGTSVELVQSLVDDLNRQHWAGGSARPVRSLHVYEKIAFIRRS
jgi:hypothetical protein